MTHQPPRRLIESPGLAGECLRRARAEPGLATPPFSRLVDRRRQRERRAQALAVLAGAALFGGVLLAVQSPERSPNISAEALPAMPLPPAASVASSAVPAPPPAPAPAEDATAALRFSRSERSSGPRARVTPPPVASSRAASPSPQEAPAHAGARACAELVSQGSAREAVSCYSELAQGTGIRAELALFELARLEAKVLREPERALGTLETHRRRFPQGALRSEVTLAQIDGLASAGHDERALALIAEALASGLAKERAQELELLRTRLLSERGDCTRAAEALERARALRATPAELERAFERCSDR